MLGTSDCFVAIKFRTNYKRALSSIVIFLLAYILLYIPTALVHESGHILALKAMGKDAQIHYMPLFGFVVTTNDKLTPIEMNVVGFSGGLLAGLFDLAISKRAGGVISITAKAHAVTQFLYATYEAFHPYSSKVFAYRLLVVLGIVVVVILSMLNQHQKRPLEC